jgi:hypothetical protein
MDEKKLVFFTYEGALPRRRAVLACGDTARSKKTKLRPKRSWFF